LTFKRILFKIASFQKTPKGGTMKRAAFFSVLSTLGVILLIGSVYAQDDYITKGDEAYKKFDNQTALEFYKQALEQNSQDFEATWRISRAYVDIGEHMPEEQQLGYYEKAHLFADSAVTVNSNRSEGYTRRAIATGRVALFKGVFKSIGLVKKVKNDCEKAIELNPEDHIAIYVFARTHHKVAEKSKFFRVPLGIGWGSKDKAQKLYEEAISFEPNSVMFNLDYARLLKDRKKWNKAREVLTKIENFPITDEDDEENKAEAKKLLEEIKDK